MRMWWTILSVLAVTGVGSHKEFAESGGSADDCPFLSGSAAPKSANDGRDVANEEVRHTYSIRLRDPALDKICQSPGDAQGHGSDEPSWFVLFTSSNGDNDLEVWQRCAKMADDDQSIRSA